MQIEQAIFSPEAQSDVAVRSLDHLVAMAELYRSEGNLRQAMEIYWMLVESHSETVQGRDAQQRLLELAGVYEQVGSRHQARAVYERLL